MKSSKHSEIRMHKEREYSNNIRENMKATVSEIKKNPGNQQ